MREGRPGARQVSCPRTQSSFPRRSQRPSSIGGPVGWGSPRIRWHPRFEIVTASVRQRRSRASPPQPCDLPCDVLCDRCDSWGSNLARADSDPAPAPGRPRGNASPTQKRDVLVGSFVMDFVSFVVKKYRSPAPHPHLAPERPTTPASPTQSCDVVAMVFAMMVFAFFAMQHNTSCAQAPTIDDPTAANSPARERCRSTPWCRPTRSRRRTAAAHRCCRTPRSRCPPRYRR